MYHHRREIQSAANGGRENRGQETRVAVGTAIADRPPHRSVRAELPHTAPPLDGWRQSIAAPRTLAKPCDTPYPFCAGGVWLWPVFSLGRTLPSSLSAAAACYSAALFEGFIGTTARSDSSPPFMPVVRLLPSPAGLPVPATASDEVSRFSCM